MKQSFPRGEHFFTRDRSFYGSWLRLFLVLALQNIITYSVNVADNVMLGSYSQAALSGAAVINQIQYVLQSVTLSGIGEGLVTLGAQYWGRKDTAAIRRITRTALIAGWALGAALTLWAFAAPETMVRLFTTDEEIVAEGVRYLSVMRYTYLIFITTSVLLCMLRSVQIAGIAFRLSVMTLLVNVSINYCLIFGHFGFPELGIRGAAIGTLIARVLELAVLLAYLLLSRRDAVRALVRQAGSRAAGLARDYGRVTVPCVLSSLLFSLSVAMQTVIMGHLNGDAIAANSATSVLFQYAKMIPISAAAATGVIIGKTVGSGDLSDLRARVRTLQVIFLGTGLMFSGGLLLISGPVLSLYRMTEQAMTYAGQMIAVMAVTSFFTGYQMPCLTGIIRGGGDARSVLRMDILLGWGLAMPLSLCAAFWWGWSVPAITFCLNVDQIAKAAAVTWKINRYTWVKKLTR